MNNAGDKDGFVSIIEQAENVHCNESLKSHEPKDSKGRRILRNWLHSYIKIEMTDGRILVGAFMCTDRDNNIILASCTEHLHPDENGKEEEPRVLGLAMIPGRHIVSICIDESYQPIKQSYGLNTGSICS